MSNASIMLNGSRAYLSGASKHCGMTFYHLSYDSDLAHQFKTVRAASQAQQALNMKQTAEVMSRAIWKTKA